MADSPPPVADSLRHLRESQNLTQDEATALLRQSGISISKRTLGSYERGKTTPDGVMEASIRSAYRGRTATTQKGHFLSPRDTASSEASPESPAIVPSADLVPIFDHATVEAAATPGGIEVEDESVTGVVWLPRALLREFFGVEDHRRVRRISVTGSSMMPTLMPGQKIWVVLPATDDLPMSGAIYLIRGPYGLFVKRLVVGSIATTDSRARQYRVTLVSDNPDKERYGDEVYPLDVFRRDFTVIGHIPRAEIAL